MALKKQVISLTLAKYYSFSTVTFRKFCLCNDLEKRGRGAALCFRRRPLGISTRPVALSAARPRRRLGRHGPPCPRAGCATGSGGPGARLPLAGRAPGRG